MPASFVGKRVIVTGASGGIGAGIALAFAQAGAQVVVHYRSRKKGAEQTAADIREAGGTAVCVYADLRVDEDIEQLVAESLTAFGGIDILVNNAGIVHKAAICDTTTEQWDTVLNTNLRAPMALSRAVAQHMIAEKNGGVILNNTSIHGFRSTPYFSAYAASKAALDAFTQVAALEWAEYGLRVNAFAPGVVPVERTEQILHEQQDLWMPHIPQHRFGTPADIAHLVLFLASSEASWITGQIYPCDGGMTSQLNMPKRPRPAPPQE